MQPTPERWVPIPEYEDSYEVSDLGRVRSLHTAQIMSQRTNRLGYRRINLNGYGTKKTVAVHRLVLLAFEGPPPPGTVACHADDDKSNNTLVNLRWDTSSANNFDRVVNGGHYQRAKTRCDAGHPYDDTNTRISPDGWRVCRACEKTREAHRPPRRRDRRRRAASR